jgi:hypothetical protein
VETLEAAGLDAAIYAAVSSANAKRFLGL